MMSDEPTHPNATPQDSQASPTTISLTVIGDAIGDAAQAFDAANDELEEAIDALRSAAEAAGMADLLGACDDLVEDAEDLRAALAGFAQGLWSLLRAARDGRDAWASARGLDKNEDEPAVAAK